MSVRNFRQDDTPFLFGLLTVEGLTPDQMDFEDNETWVYDDGEIRGFYTFRIEHDIFPHLQHFCIDRDSRGGNVARALIRHFKDRVKAFRTAIINSPNNNEFVDRVIRRYFGVTAPYATDTEHKFYLVQV